MRVGARIATTIAVVFGCFALVSGVVYRNTLVLIDNNAWVVHTRAVLESLETVLRATNRAEAATLELLIARDRTQAAVFAQAHRDTLASIDRLEVLTRDNAAQQARLETLRSHSQVIYDAFEQASRLPSEISLQDLQMLMNDSRRGSLDQLRQIVQEMKRAEQALLSERGENASAAASSSLEALGWGSAIALVLCLLGGILLHRSIVQPVKKLLRGAAELGSGNLAYRTDTHTSDELGSLGAAFNAMAESLSRTMVTADTEKRGRERVQQLLSVIADTANQLLTSTAEIVAATSQQAAGAKEQVAAVAQTVQTVNEVVASAEQARERAQTVASAALASAEHGRSGRQVVEQSLREMENVRVLVERSADSTLSLAETAQIIGGIITTVSDIAEQTNILALNAAIEATRAGGQGTAFRIVASEIKVLAGETKRLAAEVRQMISSLQKASGGLVVIAEQCTNGVSSAASVIARADASISALAQVIEDTSQTAVQISASANQQATGTAQIHQAIEQIREATVQNLSATRQMEQAAKELKEMGARLRADLQQAEASSSYVH